MILALGTVTLDTIDTPTDGAVDSPGGSALYFAAAASSIAPVRPVGVKGDDYPTDAFDVLQERGVDLAGLRTSGQRSFRWHAKYHAADGSRTTISSDRSILDTFHPTLTAEEAAAPWVFLGSIDPRIQRRVMDQAKAPVAVAYDSMSHWIKARTEDVKDLISQSALYFGSEDEVQTLGESDRVDEAALTLLRLGPEVVVVKRGRRGATVITRDLTLDAPAQTIDAIDPTGAGDAFAGAFVASLVTEGWTPSAKGQEAQGPHPRGPLERALASGIHAGAKASSAFSWDGLLR